MDIQQIFHNLTIKFRKNKFRISFRGPSQKEIKPLPLFKSKLKLLIYFSPEFSKRKATWWQSHSGFLQVLPRFKNQYEFYYLKLEKYLCSIFVRFCNIWRLYEENIWYDMMIISLKYFPLLRPFKSVISLNYFTSFN